MVPIPFVKFDVKNLYHYCSLDSFMSIVKNKELWLSRVDYTNDKYEMRYVNKRMRDIATELAGSGKISEEQKEDILLLYRDDDWYDKPFIGCFSKNGDNLNQWRLYADDAKGVSIGFSSSYLIAHNKIVDTLSILQEGYIGYQVKYFDDAMEESIKNELEERAKTNKVDISIDDILHFKQNDYVKSNDFAYEEEYRILYQPKQKLADKSKMKFRACKELYKQTRFDYRVRDGKIVPYWEMPIDGCISEVVIGAKCNANPTDLQWFLYKYGFEAVDVKKSEAPYQ